MTVQDGLRWLTLLGEWVIIGLQIYIAGWLLPRMVRGEVGRRVFEMAASLRPEVRLFLNGEELVPEPAEDPPPQRKH